MASSDKISKFSADRIVTVEIPTATIPSRTQVVLGQTSETSGLEEFRGIPYGLVKARWEHSLVRDSLPSDVFDARRNGPRCPQPAEPNNTATFQAHLDFPTDVQESEFDCLNLFVVRPNPALVRDAPLPVYFYIHGGGYGFGAGTDPMWNPTALVAQSLIIGKPIVAVNINYRLNIFGFGCSNDIVTAQDPSNPIRGGNFGLGDQRRALEWVVKNIGCFGGDNTRITIGGQSAGGSSTHAHVLDARLNSKGAGPLFRRAIIQSGAVGTLGPISLPKANANFSLLRSQYPDLNITALKKMSVGELIEKTKQLGWWVFPLVDDGITIKPAKVGRWHVSLGHGDAVLDGNPRTGTRDPLRVMLGDTDVEASIWHENVRDVNDYTHLEALMRPNVTEDIWTQLAKLYHFDANTPLPQLHEGLTQLLTDIEFGNPVYLATRELLSTNALDQTDDQTSA
ncbi:hypothetical protein QM012_000780 [Aureobasidium pullulans]|uniref:Carboxylic ester hydrolase n=1 Tax=Aureobasidium pullulans TaxID=5580 RepID=A0ABR0TG49_AURPU